MPPGHCCGSQFLVVHTTSRKLFSLSTQLAGKCVKDGGCRPAQNRTLCAAQTRVLLEETKKRQHEHYLANANADPLCEKMQTCIDRSGKKALGDVMQLLTGCWLLWAVHNNQSWVAWAHLDLVFSMLQLHIIGALFNRRPVCARHAAPKLPNCDCSLSQSYLTCWSCVRG
jgi:hypothetical protein